MIYCTRFCICTKLARFVELANDQLQEDEFEKNHHINSLNNFEKVIKENYKNMLKQNVLDAEQMIDDDLKLLTIAHVESF